MTEPKTTGVTEVTVYVNNRIDGETKMSVDEIASKYWASKWANEPYPRERSFGLFLMVRPDEEGLGVTIAAEDGVSQDQLLDLVLERKP